MKKENKIEYDAQKNFEKIWNKEGCGKEIGCGICGNYCVPCSKTHLCQECQSGTFNLKEKLKYVRDEDVFKDVKEFIRLLKAEFCKKLPRKNFEFCNECYNCMRIDKHSGFEDE